MQYMLIFRETLASFATRTDAAAAPAYAFQAVWTDADGDGLPDLFVANDSVPNYLFRNLGPADGAPVRFEELGLAAGCALSDTGKEQAGMGVAVGDLDGEGRLFLMEEAVDLNGLKANLAREAELNPGVRVTLAADGRIHYQQVVGVLDAIKQSGVTRVALASEQGSGL